MKPEQLVKQVILLSGFDIQHLRSISLIAVGVKNAHHELLLLMKTKVAKSIFAVHLTINAVLPTLH